MLPKALLFPLFSIPFTLCSPTPIQPRGFTTISTVSADLSERGISSITRNDLTLEPCRRVTIIFARGTVELGNVGSIAGPPFFIALEAILGKLNVAVQGVDYKAEIPGFLDGGDVDGATKLAAVASLAASRCPETQIVLSGYSQGAQVVHLGAKLLSSAVAAKIRAAVLFGDPLRDQPLQGISSDKVVTYCFETDLICGGAPVVLPVHLSYAVLAIPAAKFVVTKLS